MICPGSRQRNYECINGHDQQMIQTRSDLLVETKLEWLAVELMKIRGVAFTST